MRQTICCAIFALLAASGTAFPQRFRHRHFGHPRPVAEVTHFYGWCSPWLVRPFVPLADRYAIPYGFSYPAASYTVPTPSYLFVGSASVSYPQLVFNDGTRYTVADYWREEDQLHFITVEENGTKSVSHTVPFNDLDIDRTKERAKAEGFRFVVRDKPIEQWLEDRTQRHASPRKTDSKK